MSKAYYQSNLKNFCIEGEASILGKLAAHHRHDLEHLQRNAWIGQIHYLQDVLAPLHSGEVFFEFIIPRMGKRADCIILFGGVVFVIEFKVGSSTFDRHAIEQVHDYALDLKNFHEGSHSATIVPVLIATKADRADFALEFGTDGVATPVCIGLSGLDNLLTQAAAIPRERSISSPSWEEAGYKPTPTIIEAAQALYKSHDVTDISRSDASAKNLMATSDRIAEIIETSKRDHKKSICFVTGVPGAGKTLAGLNIAASRAERHENENAVFLSGNGPLVTVLREALARDKVEQGKMSGEKISKKDAEREVNLFIQNIHHFRDHYLDDPNEPFEHVVVFDEAQRAWTTDQASKFMKAKRGLADFNQSEPEFLIGVMDRHSQWCTIVCLIGGGQEINTGEAGLGEWLRAVENRFSDWEVHASSLLEDPHYTVSQDAVELLHSPNITKHEDLHLSVSMRSFRAETLSAFVSSVLDGDAPSASAALTGLGDRYPIFLTRDLDDAKNWLNDRARGSERTGLVASSGAHRLRPEGIHIKSAIDPKSWFLNDCQDVRSSYYLEDVATEFDIQGLELDWAGMCWDADLRMVDGAWQSNAFKGSKWQTVRSSTRQVSLLNAYRVLLTRARQGMIIFVPNGDPKDPTRPPDFYDQTYDYLRACGISELK
ncbi:DNA/RNA helicase domain-containing protein [Falsihalocynthiibacter sp. S25ZX9]|uniref:DNA/RNA helicase domain-containing protein n=1 Tax=Falsihalocynthiibacter sp. S25ZX9 TaxID=3240870 RepID=UPI00350F594D